MKINNDIWILTDLLHFIKKRKAFFIIGFLIVGTFLIFEWDKYSSFEKRVAKSLHEDTIIESMTIRIYDMSKKDDFFPERKAWVTIKDQETINAVLEDFSGLKLKRDEDARRQVREYEIKLLVTNEVKPDLLVTKNIYLEVDEHYLEDYKILGETEHLKTIKSLEENEEIKWETNE
ncbi:hypothetical protein IMZ08_18220 [Bacillus luteolus]|uniref:Uncharacterized protein n=1 Tax=Litchfieldia luteola TaxID=682179 RepID=A0ABR9QNI1_9BACI|nr:hypothetical protein [Cytobacillus luteolus]MBE4909976.1 hypothetical protein [Cytobacillus luteolus]MBP1942467.1 hypothetical protein [Cytobacillus luteolus]